MFSALKRALVTAPVLAVPNLNKPFRVASDASVKGTGAVFMKDDHVIAYSSRKFKCNRARPYHRRSGSNYC